MKKLYWFLFVYDLNGSPAEKTGGHVQSFKAKLKQDIIFMVLMSYTLFIFNPLVPYFADIIAHTFWEKEHLAAEHALHGKNHAILEMSRAEKQSEKSQGSMKSGSEEYFHSVSIVSFSFSTDYVVTQSYTPYRFYCSVSYPDSDYRPPRA